VTQRGKKKGGEREKKGENAVSNPSVYTARQITVAVECEKKGSKKREEKKEKEEEKTTTQLRIMQERYNSAKGRSKSLHIHVGGEGRKEQKNNVLSLLLSPLCVAFLRPPLSEKEKKKGGGRHGEFYPLRRSARSREDGRE